jgi:hypothetical protein
MTGRIPETSPRRAAQIAGIGYLIIFVLALFANFVVVNGLIESGDAAATAANITDSEGLFRWGIVAFAVVFVVDVVIAWALYLFFKSLSRELSLLTAWFRLVYTVFLGVGLVFLYQALQLLGDADYLTAFDRGQREAQTMVALDEFDYVWLIGLVAFGVHLILLGYLVVRSGYVTRLLGYVVMVAGAAYILDTTAHTLLSTYGDYETLFLVIVAVPSVVGELWLGLWLLLRGGKERRAAMPQAG